MPKVEDLGLQVRDLGGEHVLLGIGHPDAVAGTDHVESRLGHAVGQLTQDQAELILGGGRDLLLCRGGLHREELREDQLRLTQQSRRDVLDVGRHVEVTRHTTGCLLLDEALPQRGGAGVAGIELERGVELGQGLQLAARIEPPEQELTDLGPVSRPAGQGVGVNPLEHLARRHLGDAHRARRPLLPRLPGTARLAGRLPRSAGPARPALARGPAGSTRGGKARGRCEADGDGAARPTVGSVPSGLTVGAGEHHRLAVRVRDDVAVVALRPGLAVGAGNTGHRDVERTDDGVREDADRRRRITGRAQCDGGRTGGQGVGEDHVAERGREARERAVRGSEDQRVAGMGLDARLGETLEEGVVQREAVAEEVDRHRSLQGGAEGIEQRERARPC